MPSEVQTGCLIIGSGIAGLSVALQLGERGIPTVVISAAASMADTNTARAQGGIIYESLHRDPHRLAQDIFSAGCGINFPDAVQQAVTLGPTVVREVLLEKVKVPFDREPEGSYRLTREGGHGEARILHRGDESGLSIEESLYAYCQRFPSIRFLPATTAVNLLMTSFHGKDPAVEHGPARCFGAFVFDQTTKAIFPIFAAHTVLATGGVGQLYLHNTNSKFARGDGIALAYRAGCRLASLEYVQFHPTTFYHPVAPRFLISEALRGEGAVVVNVAGQRFLATYGVSELSPRDRVAKAIHQEMLASGNPCVYLDISHKPADWVRERFPFVYRSCLKYDIDITREPIPVVPGAHYHCGGVWTDLEGRTSVPHLWAVGEVACTGLHGANRLASTSLLEGLVWGTRAAVAIARDPQTVELPSPPDIDPWIPETLQVDPSFLKQDWLTLKHTMWNYVGLIKTDARLTRAGGILGELHRGIESFYRKAALSDELIGLRHASLVALLILSACERNASSLGCYLREDWEI